MTPLEYNRLRLKNHVYGYQKPSCMMRRISSRSRMRLSAQNKLTRGKNVNDTIRRESSFYKKHSKNMEHIFKK